MRQRIRNSHRQQPQTVFLLGNGRSGTRFLCSLFRNNVANCIAVHEPYLSASRPSMFGRPIYDYTHGHFAELQKTFVRKERGIRSYRAAWYVETNHAFLKSFADLAMEAFSDMKLIHVVRNPLKACASQVRHEEFNHRYHVPFRYYKGRNGREYYRWRLTGDEPIYQFFDDGALTLFQKFFIQWIEIENRARHFLDRYQKWDDCFLLHTPEDLNDGQTIRAMFELLGVPLRRREISLKGNHNHTPGQRPVVDESLVDEMQQVIDQLPDKYLAIFTREPYVKFDWAELLCKQTSANSYVLLREELHRRTPR